MQRNFRLFVIKFACLPCRCAVWDLASAQRWHLRPARQWLESWNISATKSMLQQFVSANLWSHFSNESLKFHIGKFSSGWEPPTYNTYTVGHKRVPNYFCLWKSTDFNVVSTVKNVNLVRPTTVASLSHWASVTVYNTVGVTQHNSWNLLRTVHVALTEQNWTESAVHAVQCCRSNVVMFWFAKVHSS